MSDWVKPFASQFGDAVSTDTAAHVIQGVEPACLCSPESEAQAAAMIHFAASLKIPVVPIGGGTSQGRLAPPLAGFLALSTKRLNKLIHHEPGDMVATVQAGMEFAEFHDAIENRGQWLPIDAWNDSTIGGLVAANSIGTRAFGYGTLRDMVLGMTVINGDGVIRKCGGKVVKNVTGYALDKLYIGSFGTLGLITEVTIKLRPLPIDGLFVTTTFASIKDGITAMQSIAAKSLPLEMLRVVSGFLGGPECDLYVGATGTRAELDRILCELKTADPVSKFEDAEEGLSRISVAHSSAFHGSRDQVLREVSPIKNGAILRFGVTSTSLDAAMRIVEPIQYRMFSIGLSDAIINLDPLTESEAARIASEFEKLGVNFAFENVVGLNIPNRWGSPRPEWAIMKQLKAALDPQGIMNPGRFVV